MKGVTGVERISSVSQENGGVIIIEVIKGFDTDVVLQDVKNAVDRIPSLPDGMEPIRTFKLENIRPAVSFALSGEGLDLKALKTVARRVEAGPPRIPGHQQGGALRLSGGGDRSGLSRGRPARQQPQLRASRSCGPRREPRRDRWQDQDQSMRSC